MRQQNHKRNMAGSTLLYVLLALAVIGLIFSWVIIKSRDESIAERNAQIAELEKLNDDKNADNAKLTQQLATSEQNNADLTTLQLETKRQLSFSRAANQRAEAVSTARSNLMGTASELRNQVADLSTQNEQIEPLKKSLSFANAANNRLNHVAQARDNLIVRVKEGMATNAALSEQAATIPGLKSRLSYANAANSRLEHIKEARGKLMVKNQALQLEADKVPGLVQNLDLANAENSRLRVIEDASRTFIQSIKGSVSPDIEPRSAVATENDKVLGQASSAEPSDDALALAANKELLAETEKKRSFAAADAQRARQRLKAIPNLTASIDALKTENEILRQDNSKIPVLKKNLSVARAQLQRLDNVVQARQNLMQQLAEKNTTVDELETVAAEVPVLKKELSFARAENKRLQHTANARDNLVGQIQDAKSTISTLEETGSEQLQTVVDTEKARSLAAADAQRAKAKLSNLPRLAESISTLQQENENLLAQTKAAEKVKKELSHARANVSRLEHVSRARDNLMEQLGDAKSSISSLEETTASASQSAADAEKKRSLAAADAQRAKAKAANIPRLATTINELKVENEQLSEQTSTIPALKKDLSMARAQVQRLDSVKKARENLMGQLKAVSMQAEEAETAVEVEQAAAEDTKAPEAAEESTVVVETVLSGTALELQAKLDALKPELQKNIVFASGSAWVNFKARKSLNKVAELLTTYPDNKLLVAGHTDAVGKASVNKVLSQARAERVVEYLVSRNVDAGRMSAVGFGSEKPLTEAATENAPAENRRVEFTVEN